ncbi:arylsulfotransferase family protein [Desulfosporosinus sp. FKB]|uniref:arylsulfotransferase family protein n=1 Tax=Desulfosporosinus sp. FKB TaxID=1969835 RepID=UPI000B4A018B|nr:arylsulfotransferase family protein [Desulfosporosinus sp. FKB]
MKKRLFTIFLCTLFIAMMIPSSVLGAVDNARGLNYDTFDYAADIAAMNPKNDAFTTPDPAEAYGITVTDDKGATGVQLSDPKSGADGKNYYLNAMVAGNDLKFKSKDLNFKDNVTVTYDGVTQPVKAAGKEFKFTPQPINIDNPVDEIINIAINADTTIHVHMVNDRFADFKVQQTTEPEAGVYTFAINGMLYRTDTKSNLVYYRVCWNDMYNGVDNFPNFKVFDTKDGRFYTFHEQLNFKDSYGYGFGMIVVMDKFYREVNYITLAANDDPAHQHGEGYLDFHEFQLYGQNDYFAFSYMPLHVYNVPDGLGLGKNNNEALVFAGIWQDVQNGKIVHEYCTADYPNLYKTSMAGNNFKAADHDNDGNIDPGLAINGTNYMDYVHCNSLNIDPKDGNFIVSMRHQCSVFKFDRKTGKLLWVLGGKGNNFTYAGDPANDPTALEGAPAVPELTDANGGLHDWLLNGQHYAQYMDASIAGNFNTISIFDNHAGVNTVPAQPSGLDKTRGLELVLNENNLTYTVANNFKGSGFDATIGGPSHKASSQGSFAPYSKDWALLGWGGSNSNIFTDFAVSNPYHQYYNLTVTSGTSYRTYKNKY